MTDELRQAVAKAERRAAFQRRVEGAAPFASSVLAAPRHDAAWTPPPLPRWRVTATLDLLVAAQTDRGALVLAQEAMREEGRYVVERVAHEEGGR